MQEEMIQKKHAELYKWVNTKICISSIQQINKNSIEFFLSTRTRSSSKTSQSKFLH